MFESIFFSNYWNLKLFFQFYYLVIDDNEKVCGSNPDNNKVQLLSSLALGTNGNFFIIPTDKYIEVSFPTFISLQIIQRKTQIELSFQRHWFSKKRI